MSSKFWVLLSSFAQQSSIMYMRGILYDWLWELWIATLQKLERTTHATHVTTMSCNNTIIIYTIAFKITWKHNVF